MVRINEVWPKWLHKEVRRLYADVLKELANSNDNGRLNAAEFRRILIMLGMAQFKQQGAAKTELVKNALQELKSRN